MNYPSGITSGTRIIRTCNTCQASYESWSDDTMTIKGPLRPPLMCSTCHSKWQDDIIQKIDWHALSRKNI